MLMSYPIIQDFVLFLQACHEGVLGEMVRPGAVLGVCALDLLVEGLNVRRQKAVELERVALFLGEGRALVEIGSSQECIALPAVSRWLSSTFDGLAVRVVSWAPDVESERCPNLLFFSCFE